MYCTSIREFNDFLRRNINRIFKYYKIYKNLRAIRIAIEKNKNCLYTIK